MTCTSSDGFLLLTTAVTRNASIFASSDLNTFEFGLQRLWQNLPEIPIPILLPSKRRKNRAVASNNGNKLRSVYKYLYFRVFTASATTKSYGNKLGTPFEHVLGRLTSLSRLYFPQLTICPITKVPLLSSHEKLHNVAKASSYLAELGEHVPLSFGL